MTPHAEMPPRTRVDRPPRPATTAPRRRRPRARQPAGDAPVPEPRRVRTSRAPAAARSGSRLTLLIVFTSSALLIVALVVVAGAVGQMWILAPIMLVDFAVTAAVLVTVAKLLQDSNP